MVFVVVLIFNGILFQQESYCWKYESMIILNEKWKAHKWYANKNIQEMIVLNNVDLVNLWGMLLEEMKIQ